MSTVTGYQEFADKWQENAQLALDTIEIKSTRGIPTGEDSIHIMQWSQLEELSGNPPGSYPKDPVRVYLDFQRKAGTCYIDQWIPENPLTMKDKGYDQEVPRGITTGAKTIVLDGIAINSPEAVVEHMEKVLFPRLKQRCKDIQKEPDALVHTLIENEVKIQKLFGMNMVKGPYDGFYVFPTLMYTTYGYENYFMAYALYPEVIEQCFKLQAEVGIVYNRLATRAILEGNLPKLLRLDHDMADSRGTLVNIKTLEKIWFPHFARAIQPFIDARIRLIWHCDGNLMEMIPRLIEAGIGGFQGFQYEAGMDYPAICKMKDRNGGPLLIVAGVSVSRTLPYGTPSDVRRELDWLVAEGPKIGLFLGCSSSVTPGVPIENIKTLIEGFAYYRKHGRRI
jgi:hypothetical protein